MDINERLEYAAELFCDEKYDESNHAFQRLLDEATDQDNSYKIVERWVTCLTEHY